MTSEDVVQLAWHYSKVEEEHSRYRVHPYGKYQYCIIDNHLDEIWHTQRTTKSSRRIWASDDLTLAISYCDTLNHDAPKVKTELALSQRIAYINDARRRHQQVSAATPISSFTKCPVCNRMVRMACEHNAQNEH